MDRKREAGLGKKFAAAGRCGGEDKVEHLGSS
jgi:hypothetical protein